MPLSKNSQLSVLTAEHLRLMLLIGLLSALVFFDFLIFMYLSGEIGQLFFSDTTSWLMSIKMVGLFAAGYVARIFGGIWIGSLAQKNGRKHALIISTALMAVATIAIGFIPTFAFFGIIAPMLFLLLRIGQGVALGGLIPVTWIYMAESLPRRYLSMSSGFIIASFAFGLMIANIVFAIILGEVGVNAMLSLGWRWIFITSGILTLMLLYYLRRMPMTKIFINYQNKQQQHVKHSQKPNFVNTSSRLGQLTNSLLIAKEHANALFIGSLLSLYTSSIFMIVAILLPDLIMAVYPINSDMMGIANGLGLWFLMLGCVFYGFLADRINAGVVLMGGSVILMAQIFVFYFHLQSGGDLLLILYSTLGFSAGVIGLIPAQILRMLPTGVRAFYFSVMYNVIYALVGGMLPFLLAYFSTTISMITALYVAFLATIGLMLGFILYRLPNDGLNMLDKDVLID